MNSLSFQIYSCLPAPLRNLAASLHGYRLNSWRYGPETEELVVEALDREKWSREQWKKWQEERLAYLLHRAATKVPYYKEIWAKRRRNGSREKQDANSYGKRPRKVKAENTS